MGIPRNDFAFSRKGMDEDEYMERLHEERNDLPRQPAPDSLAEQGTINKVACPDCGASMELPCFAGRYDSVHYGRKNRLIRTGR